MSTHESFRRPEIRPSSDRTFGFVFATVFALVGLAPLWRSHPIRWWSLALSVAFLGVAWIQPALLGPLNRAWAKLGILLNKVTNPIVLGLLFFGVFTPFGWMTRTFGQNRLRLKFDKQASSYWVPRPPPAPAPDSMTRQF